MKTRKKAGSFWETLLCILVYLFPVWVFGIFFIKRSKRIHFHVFQAINLSITMLIYLLAASLTGFFINYASWRYSHISGYLTGGVAVLYALLGALALCRVIRRSNRPLPLVMRIFRPR